MRTTLNCLSDMGVIVGPEVRSASVSLTRGTIIAHVGAYIGTSVNHKPHRADQSAGIAGLTRSDTFAIHLPAEIAHINVAFGILRVIAL